MVCVVVFCRKRRLELGRERKLCDALFESTVSPLVSEDHLDRAIDDTEAPGSRAPTHSAPDVQGWEGIPLGHVHRMKPVQSVCHCMGPSKQQICRKLHKYALYWRRLHRTCVLCYTLMRTYFDLLCV